jgi:hypothetical protein
MALHIYSFYLHICAKLLAARDDSQRKADINLLVLGLASSIFCLTEGLLPVTAKGSARGG